MKVKVVFLHRAADLVPPDKRNVELELPDNATLKDLLNVIKEKVSKRIGEGVLKKRLIFNIVVNGLSVASLDHRLSDGDVVMFMTPEMGG
ncbi:MoaD/ThiS family protein [Desulfurococcaceae archaeon MEX13E-LK6-19]|nr:MoaD/ThiS family protein [Desulfurococcaceae archaeon MEX13E-LK6-19]